ncbi:MAG: hypothetical protein AAGI28_00935 [Pseudomonadota bacterium]
MRIFTAIVCALLLTGCATFSGIGGQFMTTESVAITGETTNFSDRVIGLGERLGYQYSGGDRSKNSVKLSDEPNFVTSMTSRSFSVFTTVTLNPDGQTITIDFTSVGGKSNGSRSQQRLSELRSALQAEFGGPQS